MKTKALEELFDIKKGDVVSIVGTGGKTTLMYRTALELRNKYKVLITTSAKIIMPEREYYDYIFTSSGDYNKELIVKDKGITVLSKNICDNSNKLIGLDDKDLEDVIKDFEIIILEADGSRMLPIKGWKKHEPPVLSRTTKTIGTIPVNILGQKINKDMIYGFDEFKEFIRGKDIIDNEVIGRICSGKNGIFKNSRGGLYLYINKTDTDDGFNKAVNLSEYLNEFVKGAPFEFKICFGSLKKGVFYEY